MGQTQPILVHNCDDPNKADDIRSSVYRQKTIDYFNQTLMSRLNNPKETPIIIIQQRLHTEDLCGYLLENQKEEWHLLKLPAIIEEDGVQTPLWEDKYDLEMLKKMETHNSGVFWGQYMQEPYVLGGDVFKMEWFKYYEILPKIKYRFMTGDTAQKKGEHNDFSVFQCWGEGYDGNAYLIDQIRGKWEAPELEIRAKAFWDKHKSLQDQAPLRRMYIEDKVSGTGLIQKIQRDYKIPVTGIKRSEGKIQRADDIVGYVSSGYVYFPKTALWLSDYINELCVFSYNDTHKHDDQVDPTMDAIDIIFNQKRSGYKGSFVV